MFCVSNRRGILKYFPSFLDSIVIAPRTRTPVVSHFAVKYVIAQKNVLSLRVWSMLVYRKQFAVEEENVPEEKKKKLVNLNLSFCKFVVSQCGTV